MYLRGNVAFGFIPLISLFFISFLNNKAASATDIGPELHKYRQVNVIQKVVLSLLNGDSLRRQKRGLSSSDLGNRATDFPKIATTTTGTPPSTPPTIPTAASPPTTSPTTTPTTNKKSVGQLLKKKAKCGARHITAVLILACVGSMVAVYKTYVSQQ